MYDFLTFRRMVTPIIIQVLFWISLAVVVIASLIMLVAGIANSQWPLAAMGLLYLLFGPIAVRIYCELIILFFRMNETLTDIKNNTQPPQA